MSSSSSKFNISNFVIKKEPADEATIKSSPSVDERLESLKRDPLFMKKLQCAKRSVCDSPPRKRRKINYAQDLESDYDSDFCISDSDLSSRTSATITSDEDLSDDEDSHFPKEIQIRFKNSSFLTCKYPGNPSLNN